jgi:hypothetical protein
MVSKRKFVLQKRQLSLAANRYGKGYYICIRQTLNKQSKNKPMKMKSLLLVTLATLGLTASTTAQNLPNYIPANGLVGWWPFNGNANDESGNGNNGAIIGATLTTDRFGDSNKAYNFNGNSHYISVPNIAIQGNAERTLSSWILTYDNPIWFTGEMIISTGSDANQQSATFNLRLDNQNQYLGFMGFVNDYYPTGNITMNDSVWHLAVITYKDDTLKFFVDGQFEKSAYQPGLSTIGQSNFFGKSNDINQSNQGFWIGKLDDIGIWNRALTPQEITDLYNGNICYQTITVTDTLLINMGIISYNPVTYNNTIKIFPNPTNDHITISYGNFVSLNGYQLKIENSLGQQVFQTNITQQSDYLNLTNWGGNGLYFVRIIDPQGNTIDIRKIVLQ